MENFYPSISEELLDKSIEFARIYTTISEQDVEIVKHARKSFLFCRSSEAQETPVPWRKKNGNFDVTMGAPDGAEVCELCGLFILNEMKNNFKKLDFGIYRDDGLAYHSNRISPSELEKMKKEIHKTFKEKFGLRITMDPSAQIVNFLD